MNFNLILDRNLSASDHDLPTEEKIEQIQKLEHIHLDRENISKIENLEFLSINVTHVYLQNNKIEKIENLHSLLNLRCLMLSNNLITTIENINCLKKLKTLDVSDNNIENISADEIPVSLFSLNIKRNPGRILDSLQQLRTAFPRLILLDDENVGKTSVDVKNQLKNDDLEIGGNVSEMLTRSQLRVENNYRQRLGYNNDIAAMKDRLKEFMQH